MQAHVDIEARSRAWLPLEIDRCVVAAAIVGLLLRLWHITQAPLWLDETSTALWLRDSWTELIRQVLADNHPPVYFLLLKAWSKLAGDSTLALRLPSVIASALCVPLIADSARLAAGRSAMRWAAWLAACAPLLIHHAQEARSYTVMALLGAVQFWLLLRFLRGETTRLGWLYGVTGALLAWCHYYGAVLVFAAAFALLLQAPAYWRHWAGAAAFACVAACAALAAAVLVAFHGAGGGYDFGVFALAGVLWALLTEYTLLPSSAALHARGLAAVWPYLPSAMLCALCVVPAAWLGLSRLDRSSRRLSIIILLAVIVAPYAASLVKPLGLHPRYAIPALGPLLVILAAAAQRPGVMPRLLLSGSLLVMVVASGRHLLDPGHGREDVSRVGAWLDRHVPSDAEILVTSREMAQLARFHWPDRRIRVYPDPRVVVADDNAKEIAAHLPRSVTGTAFYVVGREWVSDPHGLLLAELERQYSSCDELKVRGIRVVRISPAFGDSPVTQVAQRHHDACDKQAN